MATAIGIGVVVLVILWLAFVVIQSLRDKNVTIDNEFSLRLLPAGRELVLEEKRVREGSTTTWVPVRTRVYSIVDARIAYASYLLIRARRYDELPMSTYMQTLRKMGPELVDNLASKEQFQTMAGFIDHVALFDTNLKDALRAREVDPSEYELDRSGWDEDENDDNNR
jgi:hypothetical protein